MSLERECVRRRSGEEVVTAGGASFCFGDAGVNAKERREGSREGEKQKKRECSPQEAFFHQN